MPFIVLDEIAAAVIPSSSISAPYTSRGETLDSLEKELDLMMGLRADIPVTRRYRWINAAYTDVASSLEIEDLKGSMGVDLVGNQPLYLLPLNVGALRGEFAVSVIDTVTYGDAGGRPLRKSDINNYRRRPDLIDEPKEFFRERRLLVVWPTPQSVRSLSIDFWIVPDDLVQLTDSPILPKEWHQAILLKAREIGFKSVQDYEKGIVAENDYVAYVRTRIGRDEKEDSGRLVLSSVPRSWHQIIRRNSLSEAELNDLR